MRMRRSKNEPTLPELKEETFRELFSSSSDIIFETFYIGETERPIPVLIFYCSGMADISLLNEGILEKLNKMMQLDERIDAEKVINKLKPLVDLTKVTIDSEFISVQQQIFSGNGLLFIPSTQDLFSINLSKVPNRQPEESSFEVSVRGPRDGFVEDLSINTALVRKRLKTKSLVYEDFIVGRRSQTKVALMYMDDIIDLELVKNVRSKLNSIDIDILVSSQQLEELITNSKYSIFPLTHYTSRPDFVVEALNQGRFILIVDGMPTVIVAPSTLLLQIKTAEDSNLPYLFVSLERLLRVLGIGITILLPGFWISISAFNIEQVPFPLLATITLSRLGLPLSATMEFILMLLLFELFRESGVRLPKAVGQTVAVVGGLIVGDAAIRAGLTSQTMLVVTAVTSVASYTLVNQSLTAAVTVLRMFVLLLSCIYGIYGMIIGLLTIVTILSRLDSFGVAYLDGLNPPRLTKILDSLIMRPWQSLSKRSLAAQDKTRKGQ
ncbi:spore germination protein [Peribacillus frigoritolerans]|uniref:spore germination protein n=1 Tax=Peribacillus frigoritolerans TaxID=450367 RepID=UPI002B24A098|nr:spore germination protein [Peribacillus frigoritolerans]MEB2627722.1 spore germination protein [Peribacillus frigoritolerans]